MRWWRRLIDWCAPVPVSRFDGAPTSLPPSIAVWQPAFLKSRWMVKAIRGWCQFLINERKIGERQFCRITADWTIKPNGQLYIDMRFDRQLEFPVTKNGMVTAVIYNKPTGGDSIMLLKVRNNPAHKGDTVVVR